MKKSVSKKSCSSGSPYILINFRPFQSDKKTLAISEFTGLNGESLSSFIQKKSLRTHKNKYQYWDPFGNLMFSFELGDNFKISMKNSYSEYDNCLKTEEGTAIDAEFEATEFGFDAEKLKISATISQDKKWKDAWYPLYFNYFGTIAMEMEFENNEFVKIKNAHFHHSQPHDAEKLPEKEYWTERNMKKEYEEKGRFTLSMPSNRSIEVDPLHVLQLEE